MTRHDGMEWHVGYNRSSSRARPPVRCDDDDDGVVVVVVDGEGLFRTAHQTERNPRPTPDAFLEPHSLHPCHMLEQPEKCCGRRNQPFPRLLLGDTIESCLDRDPVVLDERLELSTVIVHQYLECTRHRLPFTANTRSGTYTRPYYNRARIAACRSRNPDRSVVTSNTLIPAACAVSSVASSDNSTKRCSTR